MTRIGVLSDTHIRSGSTRALATRVFEAFADVDLILHAGDLVSPGVLETLSTLAPVLAVRGNNDYGAMGTLPTSRRIPLERTVIGLVHGHVAATGATRLSPLIDAPGNSQTGAIAISHFEYDDDVGCIVFGHSHRPLLQEREIDGRRVLLLNPGSPTDKRWGTHFGCALLEVRGASLEARLITWE